MIDYLIVGAGFAGCVLAERLANDAGKRVLVVDKRNHIGGNAYDEFDSHGVLVHRYGPHIFHTNSKDIFDYLSRFTTWRDYSHRVLASVDGRLVPIPINLDTINLLYGTSLTSLEVEQFLAERAVPVDVVRTSEDVVISKIGRDLYEKFFRGYTRKQWGMDPSELDASVTARIPVRTGRDDRYFTDQYQAMPAEGYTRLFERMIANRNISVLLQCDYREVRDVIPHAGMIFTGPVDEYFDFCLGRLPYRSIQFEFTSVATSTPVQPVGTINYPNDHAYTRTTEFRHLTGQQHHMSTLVYEYPTSDGDPYYPVPTGASAHLYHRYKELADRTENVNFVGRLATYRYYNMDQVVGQALATYASIKAGPAPRANWNASVRDASPA